MVRAVIFDMDGVLINSMKYHIESWVYAFEKFNISVSSTDFALLEGMSWKETIYFICKKYNVSITDEKVKEIYSLKKTKFSEIYQHETYPGALKILDFLKKKNVRLALVSGSGRGLVDEIVDMFFKGYFDVVISGSDVERGKPAPEPYSKAVEQLGVSKKDVFVIENAPLGIQSAKCAGLFVVALTTTLPQKYLKEADIIFSSHSELLSYIKDNLY